jgi:hypothetical protein
MADEQMAVSFEKAGELKGFKPVSVIIPAKKNPANSG